MNKFIWKRIFNFNNYTDYSQLILVNKYFNEIIEEDENYYHFKLFLKNSRISYNNHYSIIIHAAKYAPLNIFQPLYFLKFGNYSEDTQEYNTMTIKKQLFVESLSNNIDVAKWIYSYVKLDVHMKNDKNFRNKCYLRVNDIDIRDYNSMKIILNYNTINLHIFQWLNSIFLAENEVMVIAFFQSCIKGELKKAQWLYSICDVSNEFLKLTFFKSCDCGRLEIVKWIYYLSNFDFSESKYYLITYSHLYWKVAHWLLALDGITDSIRIEIAKHIIYHRNMDNFYHKQYTTVLNVLKSLGICFKI
jgi:hypothetical protein